ncbi:MAG: transposase [Balneolaceae bacterium]|nr:transposase [Balneolaceae bacterium]
MAIPPKTKDSKDKTPVKNDTHQCSSDPDARMAFKPNKPKDMYYHGQVCVDSQHGVVTAAMGDYGDRNDQYSFPELLAKARENLAEYGLSINEVLADTGYTTGKNIKWCEQAGMTAYMPNTSNYTPERPDLHIMSRRTTTNVARESILRTDQPRPMENAKSESTELSPSSVKTVQ